MELIDYDAAKAKLLAAERELAPGGGGGDDGGMNELVTRVTNMEAAVARIEAHSADMAATIQRMASHFDQHIGRVDARLSNMPSGRELGEIAGKISQLPNWWQMMLFGVAVVGMVAGVLKLMH